MGLFFAELRKLFILFRSDPKSLAAGIIAPTVILIVFALTFGDFVSLKLAFVDSDQGEYSKTFEESVFSQISPLGQKPYFVEVQSDYDTAFALYEAGKVNGVLVVEPGFSRAVSSGNHGQIRYYFNNYNSDMAKNLRLYLDEGIWDFVRKINSDLRIEVEEIVNVDAQYGWFDIIAVAVFLLSFLLGSMFNVLYLFYKEKNYATIYAYRLSPHRIWPSLCARVLMAFFAGIISAAINALFIYWSTGINLGLFALGMIAPLVVLGLCYVFFAVVTALLTDNFSGAAVFTMATTIILWFLSGATASIKYATGALRAIALGIPNTYGLSQMRGVVFGMDPSVGGILGFSQGWMIMLGFMVVLMLAAFVAHRMKLARSVG
ncbi:MAG: ABC transporter permease [Bradymonadales bacterium]|jgi:ABC-2 type transport system permease protein